MRLIDADALLEKINYKAESGMGKTIAFTFKHFIADAPTISAEAKPIVIRSKTLMPTKDFKEWAKRIRETNPNAVVIPCDAEVVSADAVQGVWQHIESKWADNIFKCSKCGNPLQIPTVDGEPIYSYCLHCGAKMGNAWGERND